MLSNALVENIVRQIAVRLRLLRMSFPLSEKTKKSIRADIKQLESELIKIQKKKKTK